MRPRSDAQLGANVTAAGATTGTAFPESLRYEDFLPEGAVPAGSDGMAVAIFNAKKPDAIGDAVLGIGLIGLYATVVYSISKTVKAVTYKMMHDILYTDMEKTGFIWAKIRDIYRARVLARMCGNHYPDMRVVLTSGYAGEDVDAALADAPWPFLRKPYSGEQLARVLGELS